MECKQYRLNPGFLHVWQSVLSQFACTYPCGFSYPVEEPRPTFRTCTNSMSISSLFGVPFEQTWKLPESPTGVELIWFDVYLFEHLG